MDGRLTMDLETTRSFVLAALQAAGEQLSVALALQAADPAIVRRLPDWVGRAGLVRAGATLWLYAERVPAGALPPRGPADGARSFEPGQVVLDLPPGRYVVETLDVEAGAWTALESAAGGPLVAGLVCPAGAVILRVRQVPVLS